MKLAINKTTCKGEIVTNEIAATLSDTHRVVDVKVSGQSEFGTNYVDVWGGTWMVRNNSETECTVGAMDKWA